jgi:hypothetical protein
MVIVQMEAHTTFVGEEAAIDAAHLNLTYITKT